MASSEAGAEAVGATDIFNPNALAIRRAFVPTACELKSNFRRTRLADLKGRGCNKKSSLNYFKESQTTEEQTIKRPFDHTAHELATNFIRTSMADLKGRGSKEQQEDQPRACHLNR